MRIIGFIIPGLLLLLGGTSRLALAEHDNPVYAGEEEESPRVRRAPNTNTISSSPESSAPNAQTLRDIQDTISRTDPRTLSALKEALVEISQGRVVAGPLGKVALDFLDQIPDAEVQEPAAEPEAAPPGDAERAGESSPGAPVAAAPLAGPASTPAAIVRLENPVPQTSNGQPGILKTAESAGSGAALFKAFPYGGSVAQGGAETENGREQRRARAPNESGDSGGELPSGQGEVASGNSATVRTGAGATETLSSSGGISQSKQRLAGAVSSMLSRFQRRLASNTDRSGLASAKPGVFERLALSGGFTPERALAKSASSETFRKFQSATVEVGMSPVESLGAYYTVLALAWLGTLGFLAYCLKFTPVGTRLVSLVTRARR